ncbi:MAG: superinfection immunity protein [Deltaproteobacteria bacterium]|nr:superinfection immunity protein [Deltaproteobacteria bacterium]
MDFILSSFDNPLFLLLFFGAMALLYVLPSIIALARRHQRAAPIILLDIALGWTLLGWLWALLWSISRKAGKK